MKATREGQEKNKELLALGGEASRLEQKKTAAALEEKQLLDKLWRTMSCPTRRPSSSGWRSSPSPRPAAALPS